MAAKQKKVKPRSSGARLMAAGLKPVQLWLDADQHARIFAAATEEMQDATKFLIKHGLAAADRILAKKRK